MPMLRIVIGDLRERTRRYSFFLAAVSCLIISYSLAIGEFTFHWGDYIGVMNGAWIGMNFAIISTLYFSLVGFYLCKGAIAFDQKSGVGLLIGTSQIKNHTYVFSKIISNIIFLSALFAIFFSASLLSYYFYDGPKHGDLFKLITTELIIVIPILFSVAAIAVLFDSVRILRGGIGNVLYFFLWILLINYTNSAKTIYHLDLLGFAIFKYGFQQALQLNFGSIDGFWDLSLKTENFSSFHWEGAIWNSEIILIRFLYFLPFIISAILSISLFNRFSDTSLLDGKFGDLMNKASFPFSIPSKLDHLLRQFYLRSFSGRFLKSDSALLNNRWVYERVLELKLMFKNQNALWYVFIVWMNAWCLFSANAYDVRYTALPWLIVAPILIWSKMGTYEFYYNTYPLIFTTNRSISKQLLVNYSAGVFIGFTVCLAIFYKAMILGEWNLFIVTLALIFFTPALALTLGTLSRGSKLFEISFILFWYVGPLRAHPIYDQLFNLPFYQMIQLLGLIGILTFAFLKLAIISRILQVYHS